MHRVNLHKLVGFSTSSLLGLLVASLAFSAMTSPVQAADPDAVKIGILNDQSGLYADFGGPTSVVAAQMAIEDFGGKVLGKPIELGSKPIKRASPRPLPVRFQTLATSRGSSEMGQNRE
jgi:hypothetical protein